MSIQAEYDARHPRERVDAHADDRDEERAQDLRADAAEVVAVDVVIEEELPVGGEPRLEHLVRVAEDLVDQRADLMDVLPGEGGLEAVPDVAREAPQLCVLVRGDVLGPQFLAEPARKLAHPVGHRLDIDAFAEFIDHRADSPAERFRLGDLGIQRRFIGAPEQVPLHFAEV
jgi:hypothetical protein